MSSLTQEEEALHGLAGQAIAAKYMPNILQENARVIEKCVAISSMFHFMRIECPEEMAKAEKITLIARQNCNYEK